MLVGRMDYDNDGDQDALSLQKLHMDAAALAVMFVNVVALAPGFGECNYSNFNSCIAYFCNAAYFIAFYFLIQQCDNVM